MESTQLIEMFNKLKVLTLDQVSKSYECSVRTVQRQFAELEVLRCYNKNSRYYTLPEIPKFNMHGIWCYNDIHFSKYGNLRKTVKHLILSSESGLSGNEVGKIVNLMPRSFMHHFREMDDIFREKNQGVYVYFSDKPEIYAKQKLKRVQIGNVQKIVDAVAVKILVRYIKKPESSVEDLAIALREQENCHISPAAIKNFLSIHDLLKKNQEFRQ